MNESAAGQMYATNGRKSYGSKIHILDESYASDAGH
jgi:hypothetical protein